MRTAPYFPQQQANEIPFFANLSLKSANAAYAAALSFEAGEAVLVQGICKLFIYINETFLPAIRNYNEAWTAIIAQVRSGTGGVAVPAAPAWNPPAGSASFSAGLLENLFERIARWKTAPNYNDTIGTDMGIVGANIDPTAAAPDLKFSISPDGVKITFKKLGHKGIYLESRRQGHESWEFLAIDIESPYLDTRANLTPGQSEWREYRARYWDGTPVGDWSGVIRANVG